MLVLSRKLGEVIVMPGIDLTADRGRHRGEHGSPGDHSPDRRSRVYREELWNRVVADGPAPSGGKTAR